jgi:hypothetical protein
MAWERIKDGSGQDTVWEFDNEATSTDVYDPNTINLSPANGTDSGGIRTFSWPGGNVQQIYIKCRKAGETKPDGSDYVRGELSKNYYDSLNK